MVPGIPNMYRGNKESIIISDTYYYFYNSHERVGRLVIPLTLGAHIFTLH